MFILAGLAVATALSLARGGRPSNLASTTLHLPGLVLLGALVAVLTSRTGAGGPEAGDHVLLLLLAEQAVVLALVVANLVRRGMLVLGVGALANSVVVLANRGMPVRGDTIRDLGGEVSAQAFTGGHHLADAGTALPLLIDRLAIPGLDVAISLGDVLVVLGLVLVTDDLLRPAAGRPSGPALVRRPRAPRG